MLSFPISKTKIIPPRRRAELLTRKRLLDLLFESLDKKLVMVSAPAGYGKTSLLIDLAHHSELPSCWLALDELDRDPQRFIAYLIAAIAERFPHFGTQSSSVLSGLTSLEQDMERMLVTIVNEAYEQIQEHFILVLDDFHLLEGVQPIQSFLNRFIQLVDENCHLILSSRVLTSLPDLPLLVAREQVSGLSFSDLAFHVDEIQALLAQNNNLHISDEDAKKLIEETEGWITGLQFSSNGHVPRPGLNTGVGLFDYLGQQVLDRQPPALRDFLLRTSLLDEFDAPLCQAVLAPLYPKPEDWQGWINTILQNNLFALPVGADGRWLRYHHLFRDFLRARFESEYPQEVKPFLVRLGHAYEEMGEWEKAHHVYKQLNDTDALAGVIERSATPMLQHAMITLETWMNELPSSLLRTHPGFISIRGAIVYMKGDLREGLNLLTQAEQAFRREGNTFDLILTLSRRATVYRFLGDYSASLRDADEIIQTSETSDDLQSLYAEALRLKGLALYRLGQARQSIDFLERSLDLYTRLNDVSRIPVQLMETGMVYRALGYYTDARDSYEKALRIWRQEGNLTWQANLLNNLAVLHYFQGEYESAALAFEEGLLCAQRSGYTRMEALILIGLGDLYAELDDFNVAAQSYERTAELIQAMEDQFLSHSLVLAQVNLSLLQRNVTSAITGITTVVDSIRSGNSHYENGLLDVLSGRLHLLEGNVTEAIAELENAEHRFSEDGRELESMVTRIWLAAAYHQKNRRAEVVEKIKILWGSRGQVAHAVLVAIHQARGWLEGLQRDPEVGRIIRDLLTRADRFTAKKPSLRRQLRRQARVVQMPAPHLVIRAFGRAVVNIGGKDLTTSDWQTQSVRDLFFYFLTVSKPLTKEQVAEALWPEMDEPAKLKLRFKNEMYRLRRAVGQEAILFEDIYYSFNRAQDYEYDVEAFESYLARAKFAENIEDQIELYQKAVDLVHGPFLEDIYADWAMFEREHLSQAYLSALLTLADLLQKQAHLERALEICQRILNHEPTQEAAYRFMMQIYKRLSDRASILRTYQTCQEVLQRQLGMAPSKETEELYRRLIA